MSLACATWVTATASTADTVRVFAAASLQGPLDEVAEAWNDEVVISYGGSGAIARQVSQGAPADALILANAAWADWLSSGGYAPDAGQILLSNTLVIVGPVGATALPDPTAETILARLNGGRLAMGQHISVPAGIYAQAWLEGIGAWTALRPNLAETENVRAALALVARKEAQLGIVYASDAVASDDVSVVFEVPVNAHPPIQYPALALTPIGSAFLDHVAAQSDSFTAAGFRLP